ncbi:MAG: PhzF family phenazine biosynthesis protein [Actinomycetota bacterium]|nr:PhzF family phenazine biosynthesis protein [Actinomycetota bacterium]
MRRFAQVDVFTERAGLGNPVAVVLDAEGLDDEAMARFARWTNLSETTFVLPPSADGADYHLRIFTPGGELPFAGHPTLGSAHAVVGAGVAKPVDGRLVQECAAGLVPLVFEDGADGGAATIRATVPRANVTSIEVPADELAASLRARALFDPIAIDVGPTWIVARLDRADDLAGLKVDDAGLAALSMRLGATGATVYAPNEDGKVEVRSFAPAEGVPEDPVCGSGNAAVAVHVTTTGGLRHVGNAWTAHQGRFLGRDGRVAVTVSDDRKVTIGGPCVTVIEGTVALG